MYSFNSCNYAMISYFIGRSDICSSPARTPGSILAPDWGQCTCLTHSHCFSAVTSTPPRRTSVLINRCVGDKPQCCKVSLPPFLLIANYSCILQRYQHHAPKKRSAIQHHHYQSLDPADMHHKVPNNDAMPHRPDKVRISAACPRKLGWQGGTV
jgi:hypothetical protein